MSRIAKNLAHVRDRIDAACVRVGRDPAEVRLLPVSKTMSPKKIMEAHAAGYHRFGENKVQEAFDKSERLADVPDLEWSVIGHLQRNKARLVARFATEFQALHTVRLAKELDKRLEAEGRQLDVLLQVNSSGEESKFGAPPEEVVDLARELSAFDALRIRGLMTLAVFSYDRERVAECFDRMLDVQRRLRDADHITVGDGWHELSMGMSGDFELAIEHGATCVRVGQAIFGARLDANAYWPGAAD